jgi:hypothetical protein
LDDNAVKRMLLCLVRIACLVTCLALVPLAGGNAAFADDLADFNAAVENAAAHNRAAIGYLRTGNIDLASLEIDRMREAWRSVVSHFGGRQPDTFKDRTQFTTVMTDVNMRLVTADMMLNSGRPETAAKSLTAIRNELSDLRTSNGLYLLPDCVRDANAGMDELMAYNDRALDWTKPETRDAIVEKASFYDKMLSRCDSLAPEPIRTSPEFRRLVDGAKTSLTLIPKAIETRDADLLHRVLIELRSFDNLLAFRFG